MNDLITIDNYCELTKTELKFKREVTKEEWQNVFTSLHHIEGCVQFWIGDCLKYREQKWGMYDDVIEETGIEKNTLKQYKNISDSIKPCTRVHELGYTHHREVASLGPAQQKEILQKAVDEKLTVRETRAEVKKIKHADKIEISLPKNKYQVIYADPPWPVESMVLDKWESPLDDKYPTMAIEEIELLDIEDLASDDCALFLWTTHTFLHEAFHIMEKWGFKYHACITWDKGGGWTLCGIHRRTEFCLYGYKGKINIEPEGKAISAMFAEQKRKHSEKPVFMRKEIERKIKGKKIELFAREKIEGWDVWGNQI
jgi:N6-adenosine-specific RNA methylase IME4